MRKAFQIREGQNEGPGIGRSGQTEGSGSRALRNSLKNLGAGELEAERGQ